MTSMAATPKVNADLAAERAILATAIVGRYKDLPEGINEDLFWSAQHKVIWRAIEAVRASGHVVEVITIYSELSKAGKLRDAGGAEYLARLSNCLKIVGNAEAYVDTLQQRLAQRKLIDISTVIAATASTGEPPGDICDAAIDAICRVKGQASSKRAIVPRVSGGEIFARIEDPAWLVPSLQIGPGRPTCVAGYSYSGKTLAVQSMVLAMLTGRKAWGQYCTKKGGKIWHIDQEQGAGTLRRYQRLANGIGITEQEIAENMGALSVSMFPSLWISRSSISDWCREIDGCSLIVLDALRGFLPGVDENSSEVQDYVARLTKVSGITGCSFVVIHHFGKTSAKVQLDPREQLRGSSGIFAAMGAVYALTGDKDAPKKVSQVKTHPDACGKYLPDFYLRTVDVPNGEDKYWGLHVGHVSEEDMAKETERENEKTGTSIKERAAEAVKKFLDGMPAQGIVAITGAVKASGGLLADVAQTQVSQVLSGLVKDGSVEVVTAGGSTKWRVVRS